MGNSEQVVIRQEHRTVRTPRSNEVDESYVVTLTDTGKWLHAPGSDFLFAYLQSDWPEDVIVKVTAAFETTLGMSTTIKEAVKTTSGEDVVAGLYLLDQTAMTKAMNSIDGMGMSSVTQREEAGEGTSVTITSDFFKAIIGSLGGDPAPILNYLTNQMGDLQAEAKKSEITQNFGTVIGMISVMPVLNVPITTFQYAFSSEKTAEWFVKVPCGGVQKIAYDYAYTVVKYNYKPKS